MISVDMNSQNSSCIMGFQSGTIVHFFEISTKKFICRDLQRNCISCEISKLVSDKSDSNEHSNVNITRTKPLSISIVNSFFHRKEMIAKFNMVEKVTAISLNLLQTVDIEEKLCTSAFGRSMTHSIDTYDFDFLEVDLDFLSTIVTIEISFQFDQSKYFFLCTMLCNPRQFNSDPSLLDLSKFIAIATILMVDLSSGNDVLLPSSSVVKGRVFESI